jgi:hypothetical protein
MGMLVVTGLAMIDRVGGAEPIEELVADGAEPARSERVGSRGDSGEGGGVCIRQRYDLPKTSASG